MKTGKIDKLEIKQGAKGDYAKLFINNRWGSCFKGFEELKVGMTVDYDQVEQGKYTNFNNVMPVHQMREQSHSEPQARPNVASDGVCYKDASIAAQNLGTRAAELTIAYSSGEDKNREAWANTYAYFMQMVTHEYLQCVSAISGAQQVTNPPQQQVPPSPADMPAVPPLLSSIKYEAYRTQAAMKCVQKFCKGQKVADLSKDEQEYLLGQLRKINLENDDIPF